MIDCMSCLTQHAFGLSQGGTHVDRHGVTHGTLKWLGRNVLVCTLDHDDYNGRREWFVADTTVRV